MACSLARILVPTDFSETSDAALAYAKVLASRLGASVHLLHVFSDLYAAAVCAPEEHVVRTARCPVLTVRELPVRDVRAEEAEAAAAALVA